MVIDDIRPFVSGRSTGTTGKTYLWVREKLMQMGDCKKKKKGFKESLHSGMPGGGEGEGTTRVLVAVNLLGF